MGGISAIGAAHVAMGSVALASGAIVLMLRKGTARHRRVGRVCGAARRDVGRWLVPTRLTATSVPA